jgi:hypothetical protein
MGVLGKSNRVRHRWHKKNKMMQLDNSVMNLMKMMFSTSYNLKSSKAK